MEKWYEVAHEQRENVLVEVLGETKQITQQEQAMSPNCMGTV